MTEPREWNVVLGGQSYRNTAKWAAAKQIATELKLQGSSQENLYTRLNETGYFWDSSQKKWKQIEQEAKPAAAVLRVRIWGEGSLLKTDTAQIKAALVQAGYQVLEESVEFPCRPPQQLESRVYLTLQRPQPPSNK